MKRNRSNVKTDAQLLASVSGVSEKAAGYLILEKGLLGASNNLCSDSIELTRRVMLDKGLEKHNITDVSITIDFINSQLAMRKREHFGVLLMDNKHNVLGFEIISSGTINSASVHPREVVKLVLDYNANAVIFAHNHPSGSPEPSQADKNITRVLKEALSLIDVRCLDHIIIGCGDSLSFAHRGLM